MKKILCLVIGVLLISLSEAQNKGTQDQRVMEDRSRGPVSHQGGQFPGRSKLEPMPVLALPISPIRLSFGQNVLDLRDYMVNYDAISQVMLDGENYEGLDVAGIFRFIYVGNVKIHDGNRLVPHF